MTEDRCARHFRFFSRYFHVLIGVFRPTRHFRGFIAIFHSTAVILRLDRGSHAALSPFAASENVRESAACGHKAVANAP